MSACTQKTPNLRCFLKRRLTNTPRRHRLADGQLSSLYPPSPSLSSFDAASDVVLFRFYFLFEHTITAVCAPPEYQPCRKYSLMYIQKKCDHLRNVLYIFDQTDLYRFEVRLELIVSAVSV